MRLGVLVLEDEPEVREALVRDLRPVAEHVRVEGADDVEDARLVLAELRDEGDVLALVLADHRLPGTSGVDFLIELEHAPATAAVRKVLVTGQAGLEDTVRAVNEAGLDHYVAKPWQADELVDLVREQLTEYVLATGLDPLPHLRVLDAARVLPLLRDRGDR
jgi:two-component system, OmpR family, phosphate regulon response regulator PhoB